MASFHKGAFGENCPDGEVIESLSECVIALRILGVVNKGYTYSKIKPAGCYWTINNEGSFNFHIDPSSTETKHFGVVGGVCGKPGTHLIKWNLVYMVT